MRTSRLLYSAFGLTALLFLLGVVFATAARADTPVLPQGDSLPWTDPAHHTPLEDLASSIASRIAQRSVRVYCDGETDWESLGSSREFEPSGVAGFVDPPHYYWPDTRTFYDSSDITHLSPFACQYLWHYGMAAEKQTKCPTVTTQTKTVVRTVPALKKVKVRVKVNGKWVVRTKTVKTTKKVTEEITENVAGPPAPCYVNGVLASIIPSDYRSYVQALLVLAHESIHLYDFRSGGPIDLPFEIRAECFGIQRLPMVAADFGTTPDDARAIADYAYTEIYPSYQGVSHAGYPYWSADCRQDGPLDLSPGDGVWP